MLREPESELEATDPNTIQLVDEQDAKSVGTDEPDNHAAKKQSQVGLPVGFTVFRRHPLPRGSVPVV